MEGVKLGADPSAKSKLPNQHILEGQIYKMGIILGLFMLTMLWLHHLPVNITKKNIFNIFRCPHPGPHLNISLRESGHVLMI